MTTCQCKDLNCKCGGRCSAEVYPDDVNYNGLCAKCDENRFIRDGGIYMRFRIKTRRPARIGRLYAKE